MSWRNALVDYAKTAKPGSLPPEVLLMHTTNTLTIWDKFPKARFQIPFNLSISGETLTQTTLDSLSSLVASKHALEVLKALKEASLEVQEQIEDEMLKQEGFTWPISVGFHAVESMPHVHLHIISQDFVSEALKNKKHWNSFHPTHGFFLHLDNVLEWVEQKTLKQNSRSKKAYEALLKDSMPCHWCDEVFETISPLKKHVASHFEQQKAKALPKAAITKTKRKIDMEKGHEEEQKVSHDTAEPADIPATVVSESAELPPAKRRHQ